VLAPPTRDHGAVELVLDAVGPGIAVQSGSSIGAGLRQASSLLAGAPERRGARVVVLLSDGEIVGPEEEGGAAASAAQLAATLGITVHAVGIGTEAGGPIPDVDPDTGRRLGFKTDPQTGETAVSRLDPGTLRRIAATTGGSYHTVTGADDAARLLARVAADPAAGGGERTPRYVWFVALALLLLAGDAAAERARRGRR
jgi:Ca-activated chloride channel homolog